MTTARDYPFEEVVMDAMKMTERNCDVYQKFTCVGCGQRLTMEEPNRFYETGTCDKCPAVTDIRKMGCNYILHIKPR